MCNSYWTGQLLGTSEGSQTHARRMTEAQEPWGKDGNDIFAVRDTGYLDVSVDVVCKLFVSDLETIV